MLDQQVELSKAKNVWKDSPNEEQYSDSLRNGRRLREVELLQRRYPPSRVDIAGDGTIFWEAGAAKRVLRLDQPPIRSSASSGRVLGEAQPGASSFIGIHYGNPNVPTLKLIKESIDFFSLLISGETVDWECVREKLNQ
jgi:hypothetical protein